MLDISIRTHIAPFRRAEPIRAAAEPRALDRGPLPRALHGPRVRRPDGLAVSQFPPGSSCCSAAAVGWQLTASRAMGCRSPCAPVPARLPFYYGWVIVGLFVVDAVLCSTWSTMLLNMLTMGPLYLEWERAGQSRVLVSTMFGVGTMTAALMAPMAGRAIDRWGGQVMMPAALCIIGVGMLMISLTPTSLPWLLAPTFLLARGGAKCMTSPYRSAVLNQWFFKKRGKATATIILTQQCLTNFVVCPLYGMLLVTWGWRKASLLGFVLNVVAAPFFALLLFHTPESVGLLPDGVKQYSRLAEDEEESGEDEAHGGDVDAQKKEAQRQEQQGQEDGDSKEGGQEQEQEAFSFTRAEAFRTLPVWLLMFDGFCGAIIGKEDRNGLFCPLFVSK